MHMTSEKKMKIAIIVHGRFHAFDLARELLRRGHDVTLFTNYPKWAVKRFEFPKERVRSFWPHGVLSRLANKVGMFELLQGCDPLLKPMFDRWASKELKKEKWDVIHTWSGVSEDTLRTARNDKTITTLARCSAHIRTQAKLLLEEEERTGTKQDKPNPWILAREEREYALAELIVVLSSFSYKTFIEEGMNADKVKVLLSATRLDAFLPKAEIIEQRCERLLQNNPLRVLYVGTFCYRKGMWDIAKVIKELGNRRFEFRFVGPIAKEARRLASELKPYATFIHKQPQHDLPGFYAWGDVFLLPTIEDGFQAVLNQASAACLPIITTPNGAGYDLIKEDVNGWIVPIRKPEAIIDRLLWCDNHRKELTEMVRNIYFSFRPRDFAQMAKDYETIVSDLMRVRNTRKDAADIHR